ncbi:MAG: hypothetical protein GQ574_11375 [Crocinitomix sp.]|nr:hypothetical protein [Crocinitomix sp.]
MKRKVLLLAAAVMLSTGLSAQFQVGLKGGYALGASQAPLGATINGDQTTTIYGTNGQGIPFGVEFRYLFGDNFGIQLDATYLLGSDITNFEVLDAGWEQSTVTKSSQFRIAPTLVFKTGFGIYSRFGALIPLTGKTIATSKNANGAGLGIPSDVDVTVNGKFGLGFVGALGYELTFDNIGIFGELEYIGLAVKRASTEITKYEFGGIDQLPNLTDEQINTAYEDATTAGGMIAQGTSSPFSSIGLNIGVRFNIGGN